MSRCFQDAMWIEGFTSWEVAMIFFLWTAPLTMVDSSRSMESCESSPRVWLQLEGSWGGSDMILWLVSVVIVAIHQFACNLCGNVRGLALTPPGKTPLTSWSCFGAILWGINIAPKQSHNVGASIEGEGMGKLWVHWLQFLDWVDGKMANSKIESWILTTDDWRGPEKFAMNLSRLILRRLLAR